MSHIYKTSLAILYLISKVVSLVSKQNLNISKYVGLLETLNENMSKKLLLHRFSISLNSINNVRLIVVLWTFDNLYICISMNYYCPKIEVGPGCPDQYSWKQKRRLYRVHENDQVSKSCKAAWSWLPFLFYFFSHLPCQPSCPCQHLYTTTKMRFNNEWNILERPLGL